MGAPTDPEAARRQAGVFTRGQAYDSGLTRRQVRRRLEVGHWRVVGGIAIGPATLRVGPWQLAYAITLSWPDAVVSHELAAALHGFPVPAPETGVATVAPDRGLRGARLRARRLSLDPHEVGWIRNVPLTTPRRTAIDLLAAMPWDQARDLLAWAGTRGVLSSAALAEAVQLRPHRPGTPQLRRLLRASAGGSMSAAEDRLHEILGAAGLTEWAANAQIVVAGRTVAVVDVLFAAARLVVQADGWRSHGSRAALPARPHPTERPGGGGLHGAQIHLGRPDPAQRGGGSDHPRGTRPSGLTWIGGPLGPLSGGGAGRGRLSLRRRRLRSPRG